MKTDEPLHPVFDITLGAHSRNSSVRVNDQDISAVLAGCQIECLAGELTKVTLIVLPGHARVTVQGAIEAVTIKERSAVFARRECIWKYCPDPDGCQAACAHPTQELTF